MRATFACAAALLLAACHEPVREWPAGELRAGGKPVTATLAPGGVHHYRLPLQKGHLLRLVVDQQGIDAVVALDDPGGAHVLKADRPINGEGPELVLAVADRSGDYTLIVRGPDGGGPGRYRARIEALRPATEADRRSAAAYQSFTGAEGLEAVEAMRRWTRALATWRELGEVALEAETLNRIAKHYHGQGQSERAAELYREAAAAFARAGDHRWEAITRTNLGASLLNLWKTEEAAEQYALALSLARREVDHVTEAKALHGLGQVHQDQGELQEALDNYQKALALWPESDRTRRPSTLHNLGVLYARALHDSRQGHDLLLRARDAWLPDLKTERAISLNQLGRLAFEEGRLAEAREDGKAALALQGQDGCNRAVTLAQLALVEEAQGARPAADTHLAEALRIVGDRHCSQSATRVFLRAASLAEKRDDTGAALAGYRRCRQLFTEQGDRTGLADSLAGIARGERARGDREAALEASRRALEIFEGVRPTILREDLRTTFFSSAQSLWDFHIDLLLEMGRGPEAWMAAEQARARALRDLLVESGAGLRRDTAPALVEKERVLRRRLNALESRRLKMGETNEEKLRSVRQDIDELVAELESLRGELRRNSPGYASLLRPEPVTLSAVQRELLDGDTVLLEYRLGETASTVWAVTSDALTAVRLPPRRVIEPLAREAALRTRSLEWRPGALCDLSRLLLAPVAPHLAHRRLVVVADGALETLSFAALSEPASLAACSTAPALVDAHEIVYLPSAAALLTQRRLLAGRRPAAGWLAVVADPVYAQARRRLPGSAQEAAAIVAGRPAGKVLVATGPAASRQTVTSGALHGFRILHFATHGTLADQPLLSALDLAERDAVGRPVPWALPAHEIYDLDLPAELVVLSACETARGREVPGEGLVSGLPRAFLYAGAARVLVSLWEVEDQSTRDLMSLFYHGLLDRGLPPARALQEAQRTLRQEGRRPNQWAGFILLGDWRPLPPFSS